MTITQVPGVIDLMNSDPSSSSSSGSDKKETDDEETDLEGTKTCDLPRTCDFAPARLNFASRSTWDSSASNAGTSGDDGADSGDKSSGEDSDDKSKSLL
jgi:hypothetical protein